MNADSPYLVDKRGPGFSSKLVRLDGSVPQMKRQ
jgi:hypothetical protein